MKVGILSMQRICNYGSFMQSYALKRIIESLGHEVQFVDYEVEKPIMKSKNDVMKYVKGKFRNFIIDAISSNNLLMGLLPQRKRNVFIYIKRYNEEFFTVTRCFKRKKL